MADLVEVPADATWPTYMTGPHPAAVGSHGLDAEEWIRAELGIELRWWQRLSLRRSLEHDRAGGLVWQTVLESTPRRSGKTTLLKCRALVRVAWAQRYGETQLVLMTGKDLAICLETHRRAWRWARERGWVVMQKNGYESIEADDESRWIVRGRGSVYGYDVTLGMVDEAWDVDAMVVDEGMEPSLLERLQPQLLLTSTAHRKATPLMARRIDAAMSGLHEETETLLLLWCAPAGADITDEGVWRQASPHWTEHRRKLIAGKVERALRGEGDPDVDDPDPVEGLRAQYLNTWPRRSVRAVVGESVATAEQWESLNGFDPGVVGAPTCVALESWFTDGCAAAAAYRLPDGRVGVTVREFPDVASGAAWAGSQGAVSVLVGKTLLEDPAVVAVGAQPVGSTSRQAVTEMKRYIDERLITHDGSQVLAGQVVEVRVVAGAEGLRLVSKTRVDGVKAAVWACQAARRSGGLPRIW